MGNDLNEMLNEGPTLTFEPVLEDVIPAAKAMPVEVPKEVQKDEMEANLTEEERRQVDAFAQKIDLTNSQLVLQYGAGAQKKIADFSETALGNVRTKDLGEVGKALSEVIAELKEFEEAEEEKGFFSFFKKSANKLTVIKAKYEKAEINVNQICKVLEGHQVQLMKDVAMLDKMYELNLNYFKELSMYILAGKKKLAQVQNVELPQLVQRAEMSGLPEDSQKARDMADLCNRFEKKIYDLELTRTIAMQMAPQIRLIQNNDTAMSEKIQSTLVNTIPLWKSQMVLAIGVSHSAQAAKAQREVTDMTNELLRKNAEAMKLTTIDTAKETERGIVDIETLKATNQTLISTLDEVIKIQNDGREKRRAAEEELQNIETEMREKLLELSRRS